VITGKSLRLHSQQKLLQKLLWRLSQWQMLLLDPMRQTKLLLRNG